MSAVPPLPEFTEMSERLHRPLRAVAGRHRVVRIAIALTKVAAITMAVALAAALLLGRFPGMPFIVRWGLTILSWGIILATSIRLLRPALIPLDIAQAATSMDIATPESQERFLTAVEFVRRRQDALLGSRQLVDHVIGQAAADAQTMDPQRAVSLGVLGRWVLYCAPLILAWLVIGLLMPGLVARGLKQAIEPWAAVLPVNQNIRVQPGNVAIGQGDAVSIQAFFPAPPRARFAVNDAGVSVEALYAHGQRSTAAMTRIGPRSFRHDFADNQSSFQYRIVTADGASAWYAVKVIARPAITLYEKHYTYPAYSHLPAKIVRSDSGSLTGLQGTQVQVIIHTTEPLNKKSALVLAPGTSTTQTLPLTPVGLQVYQATFTLWKTTSYRVALLNNNRIGNVGRNQWPIVVLPSLPPAIRIIQPAQTIHVRPDDHVPVVFRASAQFRLTAINAFVSVDGSAPRTFSIPMGSRNVSTFRGQWMVSIARMLQQWPLLHPARLNYQLQAIDNAEPVEHVTETSLHEFIIDPGLQQSYQARQDQKIQHALQAAIQQAMQMIQQQQGLAAQIAGQPHQAALSPYFRKLASQVKNNIAAVSRNLATKTHQFVHTDYGDIATQANKIARGLLRRSANAMAQARFNANQPGKSQFLAAQSRQDLVQARSQLQHLMHRFIADNQNIALQRRLKKSLAQLAQQESHISHALAATGTTPAISRLQQQAARQLQGLLHQNKVLQTPEADKLQPQLKKLSQRITDIIQSQKHTNTRLQAALHVVSEQQKLRALAAQQQVLNQAIAQLNHSHAQQLHRAHAPHLTSAMMQAAVNNLQQNNNAAGLEAQRHIASTLRAQAGQLQRFSRQAQSSQEQAARQQALQNKVIANHLADRVQQALAGLQQKTVPADALEHAARVADAIRQQADQMLNENPSPAQQAKLQAARAAAKLAAHNVLHQLVPAGGNLLVQAAAKLRSAAQHQTQLLHQYQALQRQSRQTSRAVRKLARRQDALAAQTARAIADLKPLNSTAIHARQKKIASAINKSTEIATQIKKQARQGAPDIAQTMAQVRQQMRRAASQQIRAAKAQAQHNQPASQEYQQAALEHMQMARDVLNGLNHSPELAELPHYQQWQAHAGEIHHQLAGGHDQNHSHQPAPDAQQTSGNQQQQSNGQNNSNSGHSESAPMLAAAQQVQNAIAAEQNALTGNAQAAAQAAQSLQSAAHAMSQTLSMTDNMSTEAGPMAAASSRPGQAAPGMSSNPSGISGPGGHAGRLPPRISALGISAAQWENLGPLRQQRLINIARQKLPPGYRRLIRNYYLRIARMGAATGPGE